MAEKKRKIKRFYIVACLLGLFYQSILALTVYFSYGTVVDVNQLPMTQVPLPAFTVCNNEKYAFPKLEQDHRLGIFVRSHKVNYVAIRDKLQQEITTGTRQPNLTLVNYLDLTKLRIMTIAELSDYIPSLWQQHLLGFKKADMVPKCRVVSQKDESEELEWKECDEVARTVTTLQKGLNNCHTFLYKNNHSVAATKLDRFSHGTIIDVELDIKEHEYFDVRLNSGAVLSVHSRYEQPIVRETGLNLLVGTSYQVYVKREEISRLPPPYATNCARYRDPTKFWHPFPQKLEFTSQESCLKSCSAYEKAMKCYCWPIDVPAPIMTYPGNTSKLFTGKLGWCQPWSYPPRTMRALEGREPHKYFFRKRNKTDCHLPTAGNFKTCKDFCRQDCYQERYEVVYTRKMPWPSEDDKAFLENMTDSRYNYLRGSGIHIEIKYDSPTHRVLETKATLDFLALICYIGGLVGLWLDISFVDFWHIPAVKWLFSRSLKKFFGVESEEKQWPRRRSRVMKALRFLVTLKTASRENETLRPLKGFRPIRSVHQGETSSSQGYDDSVGRSTLRRAWWQERAEASPTRLFLKRNQRSRQSLQREASERRHEIRKKLRQMEKKNADPYSSSGLSPGGGTTRIRREPLNQLP